jgi:hypothetical protein
MKQVISKHTNQTQLIDRKQISYNLHIVAIEADGKKYILTANENRFFFVNGCGTWMSESTIKDLIDDVLNDVRVKMFVFEDIKELGLWLSK